MARLVRFETFRLARHPVPWLAVGYAIVTNEPPDELPTWGMLVDLGVATSATVAVGLFVAANAATARHVRDDPAPAAPPSRLVRLTMLLVAIALTSVLASAIPLAWLLWRLWIAPIETIAGPVVPGAIALVPAVAMAGGMLGAAAGTWARSPLPAVVALLLYAGADHLTYYATDVSDLVNTTQIMGVEGTAASPAGQYGPGYWFQVPSHLAYLLCLAGAGGALTLLRQMGRRRAVIAAALAVLCVSGAVDTYLRQVGPANPLREMGGGSMDTTGWPAGAGTPPVRRGCQMRDGVRYCAYHTYEQWIPRWERAVRRVKGSLPPRARSGLPVVSQQTFARTSGPMDSTDLNERRIAVPEDPWVPGRSETDLAQQVAAIALDAPDVSMACTVNGQARMPLLLWLTGHTLDGDPTAWMYAPNSPEPLPKADVAVALAMLDAPDPVIARGLDRHWETLVAPRTTASDAARLLGVRVTSGNRRDAAHIVADLAAEMPVSVPSEDGSSDAERPDTPQCT